MKKSMGQSLSYYSTKSGYITPVRFI